MCISAQVIMYVSYRLRIVLSKYMNTVSGKNGAILFLLVTLRNANRFSKFFYRDTLQ